MSKSDKPKVFEYLNHLSYLKDMVEFFKNQSKVFSFRYFAKKSGFASQSSLKFFLDGKRNLTVDSVTKVAKGFQLETLEAKYFENMVFMNQTKSVDEKNKYFQEMLKIQRRKKIRLLSSDQYEYFSKWYHPAIRELVRCENLRNNPKWIAKRITPMISVIEARESLRLLERLGLIQKDDLGNYKQTERAVTTDREILSMVARGFHRQMGILAIEALDNIPTDRRDVSGITFGIPAARVQELKDKINDFRKQLTASLGTLEEHTDEVYHLNIQLFPLTNKERK